MHILHLEDEGPLREILKVALQAADPSVHIEQCLSSDDAYAYASQHRDDIDLFILDIRVPGKRNGLQFGEAIRQLGISNRIIVTSAYRKPTVEQLAAINSEWMAKPWHIMDAAETMLSMRTSA
jgi:DNA-binding response OmpR family regulator